MQTIYIYIFRTEPCTRTQDSIGGEKGEEEGKEDVEEEEEKGQQTRMEAIASNCNRQNKSNHLTLTHFVHRI